MQQTLRRNATEELKPDFHLPTEIFIRMDIMKTIAGVVGRYGSRSVLITTSPDFEVFQKIIEKISDSLKEADIGCIIYDELPPSPNTEDIDFAINFLKKTNCNMVIGFGGIESLNAAKAVSLLLDNYLFCDELLSTRDLPQPPIPFVSVPAYPTMGFEIAPFFFITEIKNLTKRVYFNESIYPVATIVDPLISLLVDEEKAMKSSISTLSLSAESVISKTNNEIINTYALKAIDMTFRHLPVAYREAKNAAPRLFLSTASVMSGIAFSTALLSATMAISLAITSKAEINLDDAMCVILPHIMEFNLTSSPGKYVQMSKVMGEDVKEITVIEAAIKAVEAIRRLEADLNIPLRLSNYGISKSVFGEIADLASGYPFISNTPRELQKSEIETILIAAY
ncbi:MAG: iron-containing alcohol dehydrogenase [Spirochaetes bacterium]|nr:iron-containing alcohol dehydrogenase [Spirochaetota bacterium]